MQCYIHESYQEGNLLELKMETIPCSIRETVRSICYEYVYMIYYYVIWPSLTHIRPISLPRRNYPIDLKCKSIDWFLHEYNIGLICVGILIHNFNVSYYLLILEFIKDSVISLMITYLYFWCKLKSFFPNAFPLSGASPFPKVLVIMIMHSSVLRLAKT